MKIKLWQDKERVSQGGLMRCCLASLVEDLDKMTEPPPDGTVLDCKYQTPGNKNLIRESGIWRWNRPKA